MVERRPTDPNNDEMGRAASACSSAAWALRIAATRAATVPGTTDNGDDIDPMAIDTRESCLDAADVLEALTRVLGRPYRPGRAVALRRAVEAGLAATVECAADCRALGDSDGALERGATSAERCSVELRTLLRTLVDDQVGERSGAT